MPHQATIRAHLLRGDPLSSRELARRTGLSQPTVSRALGSMRDTIRIGSGRNSRFGLARPIGNHGNTWPVFRISENGTMETMGNLTALTGDNWLMDFTGEEPLYSRLLPSGLSEGWPWFLDELRPQGFMGRAFAKNVHRQLGASADLNRWGSQEFLLAAYIYGNDLPGNLMIGEHDTAMAPTVPESEWQELAREAVRGRPAGSSAGGDRPKFSVGRELVKFAHRQDQDGRWADLLVAEAHASEILKAKGIPAVDARIIEQGDFIFLAVRRFDRTDAGGRIGVHSLAAIDGVFLGEGAGRWGSLADRLHRLGLLSEEDRIRIHWIWDFGRAIHNSDMHFGNLAFHPLGADGFALAPVYDMLPMAYAPDAAGLPGFQNADRMAGPTEPEAAASEFWNKLSIDPRISRPFREIARLHVQGQGRSPTGKRLAIPKGMQEPGNILQHNVDG